MKPMTIFLMTALLFMVAAPLLRASTITGSQDPDPYKALEGTTGNVAFLTLTNTDPNNIAFVSAIVFSSITAAGGEADDRATNVVLVAPMPTALDNLQIAPGGTANIKFTWDAVDIIHDKDIDFGDWHANFDVTYTLNAGPNVTDLVSANLRVVDLPEPSSLTLLGTGFVGAFALAGWRRKVA